MSEGLLTVLKFCFLALLYLFLLRVVSVVVREMRSEKVAVPTPPPVAAPVVTNTVRSNGRSREKGPHLRVVEPATRRGETYGIASDITVGRASGCAVVLADDRFVSQVHARVFRRERDVFVEDLGSTNGTFVNGDRIATATRVQRGDTVQFGGTVLEVTR